MLRGIVEAKFSSTNLHSLAKLIFARIFPASLVSKILPGAVPLAAVQCSFGDRDKSRGALLSEGKHYLRVEY